MIKERHIMKKIIIFIGIIIAVSCFGISFGKHGFGTGNGSGEGNQKLAVAVKEDQKKETLQNKEIIIKVEENQVYVGEETCVDLEDLSDKISKINSQEKNIKYIFEHEYAIKATYDDVKKTLLNLEETLGISVDYREQAE